jgi:hypothetical protein
VLNLKLMKTALAVGIVLNSPPLHAREATLIDFTSNIAVRSASGAPPTDKIYDDLVYEASMGDAGSENRSIGSQSVFNLMSAELAERSTLFPTTAGTHPINNSPTAGLRIPAWMEPKRAASSSQFQSAALFSSNLSGGSFDRCDGRGFSPAWWLDVRVEARRALHFDTVAAVACEFGVPTSLLDAVIAQESGYKYWAISPKGAMGMMQIMPGTASQLGLADPFNSLANMRAGARYLRTQLDRFGRVDLALAAYNAGPHRRSLKEGRLPMIAETLNYVRTIMTNWARLSPRNVEIASVDRGAIAAAAVASSGFRSVSLVRYDGN